MKEPVKIEPLENINHVELIMWQKPSQGPPLPVLLNLRWAWMKGKPLETWSGRVYTAPPPEMGIMPVPPDEGPPLPRVLELKWPKFLSKRFPKIFVP